MTCWMKYLRKNPNCVTILNKSIRNKFEMLKEVTGNKTDILLVSERKWDAIPLIQIILEGFTPP